MKYMILTYGSQADIDALTGRPGAGKPWSREEYAGMVEFMGAFLEELRESGELVEARGLSAPVHARRVALRGGAPVVTDGPYAGSREVLAGYWVVECESFDRATEMAARLTRCPGPEHVAARAYLGVRPVDEHAPDRVD